MREFCLYVRFKASLLGVDCRAIFTADETNVSFSMEGKYTYVPGGSRTVAIKEAESASGCTVMLGYMLPGSWRYKVASICHICRILESYR
jgi:hypothetical protein